MKSNTWWGKWAIALLLIFVAIIGLAIIAVAHLFEQQLGAWKFIPDDIGIAVLVAGILGLTIDRFLKQQIIKEVFEASIGYILPPELKPEMKWIYEQEVIAISHMQTCDLEPLGDDEVLVKVEMHRKFKNVSNESVDVPVNLAIDQWFKGERESQIIELGYRIEDKTKCANGVEITKKTNDSTLDAKLDEIKLAPGKQMEIWCIFEEIKGIHDTFEMFFQYATKNPTVVVRIFEGIDVRVKFAHRDQKAVTKSGQFWYELPSTLLPGQPITIRWWRIEDVTRWLNEKQCSSL